MIIEYCQKAIESAEYKHLSDGTWFGQISGFKGVWANGRTIEQCRRELIDVLEEWLILKLRDGDLIPEIDGLKLEIRQLAVA
ncbi:MAG: type II toxin-antitoxin system HicB family antitoxin [Syntrophales bacterium]